MRQNTSSPRSNLPFQCFHTCTAPGTNHKTVVLYVRGANPRRLSCKLVSFPQHEPKRVEMLYIGSKSGIHRFTAKLSRPTPETTLGYNNTSSLRERVTQANNWPADYFISIHANASENPDANGSEVYVMESYSAAWYLALDVLAEIVRRLGTKYNGVFTNPSLYVLRNTRMPAILVELAYITNYEDNQLMQQEPYQFAYGIYVGLLNYLGLPQILS